jgi:hypothetical protein
MGTISSLAGILMIEAAIGVWIAYVWLAFRFYGKRKPRRWAYWMIFLVPMAGSLMLDVGFGLAVSAIGACVWWGFLPLERALFVRR